MSDKLREKWTLPTWDRYLQPLFQQWFDDETMPVLRGQRVITAVIGEQEAIDMTTFDSGRKMSVPGVTRYYAVDQLDTKHEIPAEVVNRIIDMARLKEAADNITTVACMWCGEEFQPEAVEEHEASCVA